MKIALIPLAIALCAASVASADVLSLTADNFDSATAGKNIFVKFFAPWCGHCKAMAPAWEQLAEDYKDSKVTLIAEVDCTEQDELCETFEIQGFPTLHYGDVNDVQDYQGGRDYDSLKEFAKENLEEPICSIHNKEACSKEVQDAIAELEKKAPAELHAATEAFEKAAEEADAVLQAEIERIEDQYEQAVTAHEAKIDELKASTHYTHIMAIIAKMEGESGEGEF